MPHRVSSPVSEISSRIGALYLHGGYSVARRNSATLSDFELLSRGMCALLSALQPSAIFRDPPTSGRYRAASRVVGQFAFQIRPVRGLTVIPAEAGIQILVLDPGLRRGDEIRSFVGSNDLKLTHYRQWAHMDLLARWSDRQRSLLENLLGHLVVLTGIFGLF